MPQQRLVIITNLYPLPWEPGRATFNRQQFAQLESEYEMSVLVPVHFVEWFKHFRQINQSDKVRYVPYFFLPKLGRRFYSVWMFCSLLIHSGLWLKRRRPEIMLASWAFPDAVATGWLAKLFRSRFYFKVHGSDIHLHGQQPARARQIVAAGQRARGIIAVSDNLKCDMVALGIAKDKIQVVYNGVNHALFREVATRSITNPYLLFVGNLKADKGVMELLQAFQALRQDYPDYLLVIAGSGAMHNEMSRYVNLQQLQQYVVFLGNVVHSQLPGYMQHAKLLVLPSFHEGVPNVLLESMAAGTPVVATAVGGIPEVVKSDISGKLFAAPEPQLLTEALRIAIETQWDKQAIIQHAMQFSWQKNKAAMLRVLEQN